MRGAAIWIDPARCGGRACLSGTRLYLEHTAHHMAQPGYTCAQYRDDYGGLDHLTDRDILTAIAWWVLYDPDNKRRNKLDRAIRKQWHTWASVTWGQCWVSSHTPDLPPPLRSAAQDEQQQGDDGEHDENGGQHA